MLSAAGVRRNNGAIPTPVETKLLVRVSVDMGTRFRRIAARRGIRPTQLMREWVTACLEAEEARIAEESKRE